MVWGVLQERQSRKLQLFGLKQRHQLETERPSALCLQADGPPKCFRLEEVMLELFKCHCRYIRLNQACRPLHGGPTSFLSENGAGFKNIREGPESPCRRQSIGFFLSGTAFTNAVPEPTSCASVRLGPASMPPAPQELSLMPPGAACRPAGQPLGWTQEMQSLAPVRPYWGPRQIERVKQTFHK